MLGGNISLDQN